MDEYHIWGAWHHARESPPLSWPLALLVGGLLPFGVAVVLLYRSRRK